MRKPTMIAALLVVASATDCSTMVTHQTATTSLANAAICCASLAQLPYQDIDFTASNGIKLDGSSLAFQFPSGKSYFAAFTLPVFTRSYAITIQSYALGETIDKAHIFYPQVDLLDERFNLITRSNQQDFILSKSPLPAAQRKTWGLPLRLEGSVNVNNPDIKYMVVYTTSELLSSQAPYVTQRYFPIILPGIVGAIPTGKKQVAIKHSPFALLFIVVEGVKE